MFNFCYSVNLSIVHPQIDPDEITKRLQLQPHITRKAGAEVVSAKGVSMRRKAKLSHWSCYLHGEKKMNNENCSLSKFIQNEAVKLEMHAPFFKRIRNEGGSVQFSIAWYSDSNNSTGVLSVETLKACVELGVEIELDFYGEKYPKISVRSAQ